MKKKIFQFLILVILSCSFSCGNFSSVRDRDTLYLHLGAEPDTLNPVTATDAYESSINKYIYETLVDRDYDTLDVIPLLAERWEVSGDKLHYRFYLKKGIKWSDGIEFTADDVVYSFNTLKDPKTASAPLKVYYLDVERVIKLGKYIIEFQYRNPYYTGLEVCGSMPIIPKHIFDDGTDFNRHKTGRRPLGTGPYIFEKWETGKKVVLSRNENYWGDKPGIKKIVFKVIPEQNTALQMLKKGEIDMMSLRDIQWIRQTNSTKFTDNFYKLKYFLPNHSYIAWNSKTGFFSDRRVRLAMTCLINREEILKKFKYDLGKIVAGNFYIFSKFYNKGIEPWPYNPEKALRLLNEAGWKDSDNDGILDKNGKNFSITVTIPSESKFGERLSTIMKEDFSKAGIEININKFEWAVFLKKIEEKKYDVVTGLAWNLGYSEDPYQLWHSSQIDKGSNYVSFSNKEADRIIESARREFDPSRRMQMYNRLQEIIHFEQPYTFLFCDPSLVAVSKRFSNVIVHVRGLNTNEWKADR